MRGPIGHWNISPAAPPVSASGQGSAWQGKKEDWGRMRTIAETEVSENRSESNWCGGGSVEQGNARVCLGGCLQLRQGRRWGLSLGWTRGTIWWSVPWRGREAALTGCCCRFSLPEKHTIHRNTI